MNKAFTKPMLDDIEWMCIYGHLKPLSIKRMLKAKYNRKIYNQDLYKVIYKHRKNNPQLVQERLEEEEDNNDYINWKSSLPCNQSSTIASNAFTNIIDELKLFVTPQIQKVHYSEMEMAFNYDARVLDQSYIKNETSQDWSFADGFIENQEIRQITFHQLLSMCNQSSIKNLWGVNHLMSSGIHHLVILLKNGIYKCSCMSLIMFQVIQLVPHMFLSINNAYIMLMYMD
uniref:Uncharacterized protein n=1 Tax=Rhizophagus irregularis (strain DAOM 181602 / DAOM 197198 / MUCL 43194) TaxID=747089 RepID=U9T110_RHIID